MADDQAPLPIDEAVKIVQRAASERPEVQTKVLWRCPAVLLTSGPQSVELYFGGDLFVLEADAEWLLVYTARLGWEQREVLPDLVAAAFAYFDGRYRYVPAKFIFREQLRMTVNGEQLVWKGARKRRRGNPRR